MTPIHPLEEHKLGEPLDYDYVESGIFIGTNQCCSAGLSEVLKKEGITADVSLENTKLDQPFGVDMYTWIPVVDTTPPSSEQMDFGVAVLEELVRQKKKIYVHCENGHGRSTTLVTAYLMKSRNVSPEEAFELIKKQRPAVHLTELQWDALRSLSKKI